MKTQIRILLAAAVLALAAGFVGLRRGNAALEASLPSAASGERAP
jgi:hypothetical protein